MDIISKFDELDDVEAGLMRKIGFEWISMANYSEIYENNEKHFTNFGEVVRFVEDVICYRMPWTINGIVRLAENELESIDDINKKELPDWFDLLPQFLRYGVSEKELVWVMSLGIQDRNVAHWLLQAYKAKVKRLPKSLKQFLVWSLDNRKEMLLEMGAVWPKYFVRLFNNILIRYDKITKLISG